MLLLRDWIEHRYCNISSPVQRSVAWVALVSRTLFQIQDLESIFNLEICCTWCSSAKRENFKYFHFFMFLSCHSNYKNIARIAHSHCKKIIGKSMLECALDCMTKNSNTNARTQVPTVHSGPTHPMREKHNVMIVLRISITRTSVLVHVWNVRMEKHQEQLLLRVPHVNLRTCSVEIVTFRSWEF